jgi:hypothetical protein
MTYDPQIPLVTESPLTSASPIQINFDQFAKVFSVLAGGLSRNHVPFNNANQGQHGAVIFQKQTADLGVTQDLDVLYAKDYVGKVSTEPQLYVQIPKFLPTSLDTTEAPNTPMQLTYNSVGTAGPIYYSFMPGGYLVYFGMVIGTNFTSYPLVMSPTPKSLLIAIANPNTVETNSTHRPMKISTAITSNDTFFVNGTPGGPNCPAVYSFTWFAIGIA